MALELINTENDFDYKLLGRDNNSGYNLLFESKGELKGSNIRGDFSEEKDIIIIKVPFTLTKTIGAL